MKRFLMVLIPFLLLSCAKIETTQTTIIGHIKGADGNVPFAADVHLGQLSSAVNEPLQSQKIGEDGTFKMKISAGGMYKLWITAVNHQLLEIPLMLSSNETPIQINAELAPYGYKNSFDEVKVIGDWNEFSSRNANLMSKQKDGTFVFETEVQADTVAYQLSGLLAGRHTVNGTMSDHYVYDGGGDYKSVINVIDGKAKIVFDPEKLFRAENANLPLVTFDGSHDSQKYFFEMDALFEQEKKAFRTYMKENGYPKEANYDLSSLHDRVKSLIEQNDNPALLQFAGSKLLALLFYNAPLDKALCKQLILNHLQAESSMWGINSYICEFVPQFVSEEKATAIWHQLEEKNPDRAVRGYAKALLVDQAYKENDEQFDVVYNELKEEYGDLADAKYFLDILDRKNPTFPGKPAPPFKVMALGSNQEISDDTLLGKYYLVDFWAVWCPPCRMEMPNLHRVYEKYKDKNFTILSLSLDQKPEDIAKYRDENWKMPWNHAFLGRTSWGTGMTKDFNVRGIPTSLLISPEGVILATTTSLTGEELDRTLARYLDKAS